MTIILKTCPTSCLSSSKCYSSVRRSRPYHNHHSIVHYSSSFLSPTFMESTTGTTTVQHQQNTNRDQSRSIHLHQNNALVGGNKIRTKYTTTSLTKLANTTRSYGGGIGSTTSTGSIRCCSTTESPIGTTTSTALDTNINKNTNTAISGNMNATIKKIHGTIEKLRFLLEQVESIRSSTKTATTKQEEETQNFDEESSGAIFWKELHQIIVPMVNDTRNFDTWESLESIWSIVIDYMIPEYFRFTHYHHNQQQQQEEQKVNPVLLLLSSTEEDNDDPNTPYIHCPLHRIPIVRVLLQRTLSLRLEFFKKHNIVGRRRYMEKEKETETNDLTTNRSSSSSSSSSGSSLYDNHQLWQLLQKWENLPDHSCFAMLLSTSLADHLHCHIQPNEIIEYMSKSKNMNQHPDPITFYIALSIWNRRSIAIQTSNRTIMIQNTLESWKQLETSMCRPHEASLGTLLETLSNCKDHQMVQTIFSKYYKQCSINFKCCSILLKSYKYVKTKNPKNDIHNNLIQNLVLDYKSRLEEHIANRKFLKKKREENVPRPSFWLDVQRTYEFYKMKPELEILYEQQRQIKLLEERILR